MQCIYHYVSEFVVAGLQALNGHRYKQQEGGFILKSGITIKLAIHVRMK
jgi:hypothetical protein